MILSAQIQVGPVIADPVRDIILKTAAETDTCLELYEDRDLGPGAEITFKISGPTRRMTALRSMLNELVSAMAKVAERYSADSLRPTTVSVTSAGGQGSVS